MGIRFACHACQKPLHIKAELAGKRGRCPQCGARFQIPEDHSPSSIPIPQSTVPEVQSQVGGSGAAAVASSSRPSSQAAGSTPSLLDDPAAVWYVRPPSGGQYGPATGDVLRSWIAESRVTSTSLVWRDGWPQWRNAAETLIEFGAVSAPLNESPRPRATAPAVPVPALTGDASIGTRKSKTTNRRILIAGGLAALSITLIVILIFLIQRN